MDLITAVRNVKTKKKDVDKLRASLNLARQAYTDAQKILTQSAIDHRFANDPTPGIDLDETVVEVTPGEFAK